jgi:aspartokinase
MADWCIVGTAALAAHLLPGALAARRAIQELHFETAEKLNVGGAARQEVESLLTQLQQLLVGISIMQDLTPRAKDSLVSFGERLSTRLFAAFLNQQVRGAGRQPSSLPGCPACAQSSKRVSASLSVSHF